MTLLISVPNKSLLGTFQKISLPYTDKGTEYVNPIPNFSKSHIINSLD